jgi:hypothetical protein
MKAKKLSDPRANPLFIASLTHHGAYTLPFLDAFSLPPSGGRPRAHTRLA